MKVDDFIKDVMQNCLAPIVISGGQLYPDIFSGNIGVIQQVYAVHNGQPVDSYIFKDPGQELSGAGVSKKPQEAMLKACVEGLERYSSTVIDPQDIVFAAGQALADHMVMDNIPLFSEKELANSPNLTGRYKENEEIRWVLGYSCKLKKQVYLPLVMTHFLQNRLDSEKFYLPISTGIAAHFNREDAVYRAILEIIERDVISTTWLANIPLPRLKLSSDLDTKIIQIIENSYAIHKPITVFVHLGEWNIPTFYAVRRNLGNVQLGTIVGCATHNDINQGILKAISEVFCVEIGLESMIKSDFVPKTADECVKIHDGALFTGQSIYNSAFDFLFHGKGEITYSDISKQELYFQNTGEFINYLIEKGLDVYLCDLTIDDVRDYGIHVIRAIIPELMPFSCIMKARYLGSKRLYDVANVFHNKIFYESNVNPFPQPFA